MDAWLAPVEKQSKEDVAGSETRGRAAEGDRPEQTLQSKEYVFSGEELRRIAEDVRRAFPRPLTSPTLVLLDVDPHRLHAFWSLSLAEADAARASLGPQGLEAQLVLQIHDVDRGTDTEAEAPAFLEVPVQGLQGATYIDVATSARRFRAQLGWRGGDGGFALLARSNLAELPPFSPAGIGEYREITVSVPPAIRPQSAEGTRPTAAERGAVPLGRAPSPKPVPGFPMAPPVLPEDLGGGTPAPIVEPFPPPPDLFAATPPTAGKEDQRGDVAGEPPVVAAAAHPLFEPAATGGPAAPPVRPQVASEEGNRQLHGDGQGAYSTGDGLSEEGAVGEPPDAGAVLTPVAGSIMSLADFAHGREDVQFEVYAELHVFGRAKPGSEFRMFGQKVTLRPDGTFSIRRPLPQGALVISALLAAGDPFDTDQS